VTAGDQAEATIESIAYRGAGVTRLDGRVVFVPGVCVGESVRLRVTRVRKNFLEAVPEAILTPSPDRLTSADCLLPNGTPVPGCCYGHMTYPAEVATKTAQLRQFLIRMGGFTAEQVDAAMQPSQASPAPLHYRNKITLEAGRDAAGRPVLGYLGEDNTTVVDLPACPLAHPAINAALAEHRADPAFLENLPPRSKTVLRHTEADGVLVWSGSAPKRALTEQTRVGALSVAADGFFQVNPAVADLLVDAVTAALREHPCRTLVDLYCGVGVFALAAAGIGIPAVIGMEENTAAIALARDNAKAIGRDVRFVCGVVERDLSRLLRGQTPETTTILLDPPRAGLAAGALAALLATPPSRILYVSCSPDTLARDLKPLKAVGYTLRRARVFDMFPRTAHFETLVELDYLA